MKKTTLFIALSILFSLAYSASSPWINEEGTVTQSAVRKVFQSIINTDKYKHLGEKDSSLPWEAQVYQTVFQTALFRKDPADFDN